MYKKIENTIFELRYTNDEFLLVPQDKFDCSQNQMIDTITITTYKDDLIGLILYGYKDKLVTYEELIREFLIDHYNVR